MNWPRLVALGLSFLVAHAAVVDMDALVFSLYSKDKERAEEVLRAAAPPALAGLDEVTRRRLLYCLEVLDDERPKYFSLLLDHGLEFNQRLYMVALFDAVRLEDHEMTKFLMEHPFKQKALFQRYELSPYTFCHSVAVAQVLLDHEVPVKDSLPTYHLTARGVTDVLEVMLARGCPISHPTPDHPSLLQITINRAYPDTFEVLLQSGRVSPFELTSDGKRLEDYIRERNHFIGPVLLALLRLYRLRELWIDYIFPIFRHFITADTHMVDPFKNVITPLFLDNF